MKSFITFLIAVLLVMTAFATQPTLSAYAEEPAQAVSPLAVTDDKDKTDTPAATPESFEVTGYSITRAGVAVVDSIHKNEPFDVIVNILDKRSPGAPLSTPLASLNTESFLLATPYAIFPRDATVTAEGFWKYSIVFHTVVYTGKSNNFNFTLSYSDNSLPLIEKALPFHQCIPDATTEGGGTVVKGTGFVLKDARYADGQMVYAGEAFTLSAVILATNGDVPVENVTVSFAPPEKLTLAEGSSVAYVGTMSPGQSVPVSVNLFPGASIEEGTYTVNIDISGINQKTGESVTATAKVSVPILQPERFEIFNAQLPSDLTAGMDDGMGYASITLVNKGKGTVANVSVEITGSGLTTSEGKQYIGNVAPGEQKSSDFNLHADAPGQIDGMVTVTYENARGEEKSLERGFAVNVNEAPEAEPMPGDGGEMPPEEPAGPPRWVWIAAAAAVVIVVVILFVRRAKKKKKASEEAYLDDDEDDL
ncbi:hypothetical protein AGMMS49983_13390 [Clostridia bacterium]|nr:hypothetical protein AGMMS49983_13390 [Clostridia bacterium]